MSKKFLIVEDSPAVYLVMERIIKKLGYQYKTVTTGEDAIEILKHYTPDMVLMDIMLPGSIDGIETAIKIASYNIPLMYCSACTDDHILKRVKKTNPIGYLVKPFRLENAKITIEMALFKIEMKKKLNQEIQERERAFSELKKLNEELQHFTFGASHDLQEPLRTIICFAELLMEKHSAEDYSAIPELTEFIISSATRMQSLIESLLSYSGLSFKAKSFEWLDSKELIDHAISNLGGMIDEKNAQIHYNENLPQIYGDKNQLIELFQNILSNSIKYCTKETPKILVNGHTFNDKWRFEIQDNGIGIDSKYKDYIFKLFKRLHQPGEFSGSGIGLVICEKIVERHKGKIWFISEPEKGTTFYFTLTKNNKE
ncbi:bacteriophytochrome (light-regulated signal transduction histidine kinase) [Candidatus Magnetomorum sp. HK-1]|nr:bacteriophytochrome (light-regulated signal transduction histidine kinase) [Candidatus Magnetomorum sp. HK-1]